MHAESWPNQIERVRFSQFLLFLQGDQLKQYVYCRGVRLIGDLAFFVSPDSSDIWANPELFLLDEHRRPRASSPAFRPTISAHRDSCGMTLFTTGMLGEQLIIGGRSTDACSARSRRCDSPRSFPRIRSCMARSGRRIYSSVRTIGVRTGRRLLEAVYKELADLPFHRGRSRSYHS